MSFRVTGSACVSLALAATLASCGAKKDKSTTTPTASASELASDPALTGSVVNASHGDVVSSSADQSSSGASLYASGDDSDDSDSDTSSITKSCAVSGTSAVVTIKSTINRSKTSTSNSGTVTVTRTRTGSGAITRTWSKTDSTAVTCNTAATGANVDFQNPNGLKLEVSFERSRQDSKTYTGPRVSRSSSKSFSATGKRTVTWSSNDTTSDTSTTYIRNKQVVIKDVDQDVTMTNKDGASYASSLTINTTTDKPLVMKIERNKTGHAVVSKTIVSGEVVVQKDTDATITTTYSNLKLSSECKPVSGSATIVFKDSAGTTLKTLTLDASSSGEGQLKDSSGSEVEGFHLDDCDSEDSH